MQLRDYQQECVGTIIDRFKQGHNNALAVLPPGAGKSLIFAEVVRRSTKKVLLITNQNKLVVQGADNIKRLSASNDVGYYNAGVGVKDLSKRITVASIQSIWKVREQFDFIIIDEAHRFDFAKGMLSKFIKHQKKFYCLGLTATPYDSKKYIFGDDKFFKSITYEKSFQEMTDNKYLVPIKYTNGKRDALISLEGVKKIAGDYNTQDLEKVVMSDATKLKNQVDDALSKCMGKTIWMGVTIEHAKAINELLEDSIVVHSQTNQSITPFTEGNVQHCVSVMMLGEGVDIPCAQTLVLMRPTRSPRLYVQAAGRILRPFEGKEFALLLDYGHVVETLGSIYDIKIEEKPVPMKMCTECDAFSVQSSKSCEYCGEVFESMCPGCFQMKPYGTVCANCDDIEKKKREYLKNLSETSYTRKQAVRTMPITSVKTSIHKKGANEMLKVDYYNGFKWIVSEYLDKRNSGREYFFKRWLKTCTEFEEDVDIYEVHEASDLIKIPASVTIEKNKDGYWQLVDAIYED